MKTRTIVLSVMFLALAVSILAQTQAPETADFTVSGKTLLGALTALTEHHVGGVQRALDAVAGSDEVRSGDWARLKPLLRAIQQDESDCTVWFARADGTYYTVDRDFIEGQNLKDRSYFPKAMAGETTVGTLVVSRSTGRNVAVAIVPVRQDGQVVGAIGASLYLDSLSDELSKELALPAGLFFYALDPAGQTALHSRTEKVFAEPGALGSPTLAKAVEQMLASEAGAVSYAFEGKNRLVLYQKSPLTGWCFALGKVLE